MEGDRKRRYYSISEVAEMMDLKAHSLRFWESEFSILHPRKNRAGNRSYTERDIKIVKLIKNLLYDEKYTIEGAKNRLKTHREIVDDQIALPFDTVLGQKSEQDGAPGIDKIEEIKSDLLNLIEKVKEM